MDLGKYENIHAGYIQYYTFLRKVFSKRIVSTLSYPVVCFQTIKYGSCKSKMRDTLTPWKQVCICRRFVITLEELGECGK